MHVLFQMAMQIEHSIFVHYFPKRLPTELSENIGTPVENGTFSILHINIRGLNNKMAQLELSLVEIHVCFS